MCEEKNKDETLGEEQKPPPGRKGLCDSCNFSVDSRLSYMTVLTFCNLHMKNNPGHKAAPLEKK